MSGIKNLRTLTLASFLVAIGIIAGFLKVPISSVIEIRFSTPPLAAAGLLFGPGIAAITGALTDIGGYVVKPTGPFFPGFTLSGILSGVIFGLFLHNRSGAAYSLSRISLAVIVNTVAVNLLLNSLWLTLLYGSGGYVAVLSMRLIKELVLIPVNIIIIAAIAGPVNSLVRRSAVSQ